MMTRYYLNCAKHLTTALCRHQSTASASNLSRKQVLNLNRRLTKRNNLLVDEVRISDKVPPESLFPIISLLGISTEKRVHKFETNFENVFKLIQLGILKTTVAAQYCHYLAHLCEKEHDPEDLKYYKTKTLESFLMLHDSTELPGASLMKLHSSVAATSAGNCEVVCSKLLQNTKLKRIETKDFRDIIGLCYKFGLWNHANQLVELFADSDWVHFRQFDSFAEGVKTTAKICNDSSLECTQKVQLKLALKESLFRLLEGCYQKRIQFVTNNRDMLIKSLLSLGVEVRTSPLISKSGICTNCENSLPKLSDDSIKDLNKSIRGMLHQRYKEIYINSERKNLDEFDRFLTNIRESDGRDIDCVIDGLNIAYRNTQGYQIVKKQITDNFERTIKKHSHESMVELLIRSIRRSGLLDSNKKLLVIGKEHMKQWPGLLSSFQADGIHFFTAGNHSKDDLYSLYAATLSPKTFLLTNDYFRDHLANFEADDKDKLSRWIDTHHAWVAKKNIECIWAKGYEKLPSVDRSKDSFHIPIFDHRRFISLDGDDPPPHLNYDMITWICCKMGPAFTK